MTRIPFIVTCLISYTLLSACFFEPLEFDEEQWIATIEDSDLRDIHRENSRDGVFFNPWLIQEEKTLFTFLRWQFSKKHTYSEEAKNNLPKLIPELQKRIDALDHAIDFLVWIGHATFLFRLDGEYWLTDPMLSERALLPKRVTPPAIEVKELADLKGKLNVVISHNHYDHLDKTTLENLPPNVSFYVPQGLGEYVSSFVSGDVTEMNWWDELELAHGTMLTCLPAQHWSRRLFQDNNTTLWASFMVSSASKTVYFGGDSGYFRGYREIGKKFNTIDYALLPITAYDPRWFMHYAHMDTKEAIRAFKDLEANYFIPTQWGTFHLGDNPPGLPPLDLHRDIAEMQLNPARFLIPDLGQILLL